MKVFIVLCALVAACVAIVCPPDACDTVDKPLLNCLGATIKNTGWCGCTDYCAKQKGESCKIDTAFPALLGIPSSEVKCDAGLVCQDLKLEGQYTPTCVDLTENTDVLMSKRSGLIVCPDNACDNIVKQDLNCKGGLLKNAGWCGCTDHCAKVRGERCVPIDSPFLRLDTVNLETCDEDLVCHKAFEGSAICLMPNETSTFVSKRSTCDTACKQKSLMCTTSFVIYEGQWFAKCDSYGNFLPEQCNNKKECFCVDMDGTIDESTRVLGSAKCH